MILVVFTPAAKFYLTKDVCKGQSKISSSFKIEMIQEKF